MPFPVASQGKGGGSGYVTLGGSQCEKEGVGDWELEEGAWLSFFHLQPSQRCLFKLSHGCPEVGEARVLRNFGDLQPDPRLWGKVYEPQTSWML